MQTPEQQDGVPAIAPHPNPDVLLDEFLIQVDVSAATALVARVMQTMREEEQEKIERILEEWQDLQAVANLLQNPQLIKKRLRFLYLLKGKGSLLPRRQED